MERVYEARPITVATAYRVATPCSGEVLGLGISLSDKNNALLNVCLAKLRMATVNAPARVVSLARQKDLMLIAL